MEVYSMCITTETEMECEIGKYLLANILGKGFDNLQNGEEVMKPTMFEVESAGSFYGTEGVAKFAQSVQNLLVAIKEEYDKAKNCSISFPNAYEYDLFLIALANTMNMSVDDVKSIITNIDTDTIKFKTYEGFWSYTCSAYMSNLNALRKTMENCKDILFFDNNRVVTEEKGLCVSDLEFLRLSVSYEDFELYKRVVKESNEWACDKDGKKLLPSSTYHAINKCMKDPSITMYFKR